MESFISSHLYAALIVFGFVEACCIPIPSEVTFGFAGVFAFQTHKSLALVIIVGSLAELAGSYASYYVGRAGGRPLVRRFGKYVLVAESDVNRVERFLEGRGAWAILVGRMLPFVRAVVSIVAGLVRVPPVKFGVLSGIGTVFYAVILSLIGYNVGSAWTKVNHGLSDATYVIVAVVVIVVVAAFFLRLRQYRREQAAHGAESGPVTRGGKHSKSANSSTNAEVR